MGSRVDLQCTFEELLGSKNVYYQPPASVILKYPCIIYSRSPGYYMRSDNRIYASIRRYNVIVIHKEPDGDYVEKMMELPYCSHERRYVADNLYHDVFNLYY